MRHGAAWLGIFLFLFACVSATAQFSPGPLSHAHRSLQGPTHCTNCHVAAGGNRRFKCLQCHTDIRQRLASNRGLHPALLGANRTEDRCSSCHSEHNGENFVPIRWDVDLSEFDHRKTGYALDGAHSKVQCRECHSPAHIAPEARRAIVVKDLKRTWLGLSPACASCHQDEHRAQLGNACERCHVTASWKDVRRFDHNQAKFRLEGAHPRVACNKCHPASPVPGRAKPLVKFTGLAFGTCAGCHRDPHRGAFSASCTECHTQTAWKPARNVNAAFDHSKTHFPLAGKHAGVSCEKCHKDANFKTAVAHERCIDCHRDRHNGQFAARAGGECAGCHNMQGWKPSTFTVAAHAASAYPLRGRHAAVECGKCHLPAGAATVYKVRHETCSDCHRDPHDRQLAAARCDECHTVERFRPSTFTLARHARARFPLAGAHAATPCIECHKPRASGAAVAYRFATLDCTACHADPHRGQFRIRKAANSAGAAAGCLGCHNVNRWREVSGFDHAVTRFALTGAHRAVRCEQCHRGGSLTAAFLQPPMECAGCHEDVHAGQMGAQACSACHAASRWRPARFDHARTAFPLAGAHAGVACAECHKSRREVNGRMVVLYKPTPKDCASCHGRETAN